MNLPSESSRMVVGQVIETLQMGGAENLALRIANELANQGHESHLIVMGGKNILSSKVSPEVTVHYLEFSRAPIGNPLAFASSLMNGYSMLSGIISDHGIQVIQTHLPGANFWGLLLAMKNRCASIATIHNNKEFEYGDKDKWYRILLRKQAYRLIFKYDSCVVAVSGEVRMSMLKEMGNSKLYSDNLVVVDNGVAIPNPIETSQIGSIKSDLNVTLDRPLILAAGRFSEQKNFADLIKAVAILREKTPLFQLIICGDGELRPELEQLVSDLNLVDHVLMPGNLTNLNDVMLAADIFCMSSLWEGLPLVLLEAMAAGLPAVGYNIKGIDEIITDGVQGLTTPTGNPGKLADGLFDLIKDEEKRGSMGKLGRKLIESRYNFGDVVEQLVVQYELAIKD